MYWRQVTKHGQKWSTLEKEMGRSAGACRDKFREIMPGAQEGGKPGKSSGTRWHGMARRGMGSKRDETFHKRIFCLFVNTCRSLFGTPLLRRRDSYLKYTYDTM